MNSKRHEYSARLSAARQLEGRGNRAFELAGDLDSAADRAANRHNLDEWNIFSQLAALFHESGNRYLRGAAAHRSSRYHIADPN